MGQGCVPASGQPGIGPRRRCALKLILGLVLAILRFPKSPSPSDSPVPTNREPGLGLSVTWQSVLGEWFIMGHTVHRRVA